MKKSILLASTAIMLALSSNFFVGMASEGTPQTTVTPAPVPPQPPAPPIPSVDNSGPAPQSPVPTDMGLGTAPGGTLTDAPLNQPPAPVAQPPVPEGQQPPAPEAQPPAPAPTMVEPVIPPSPPPSQAAVNAMTKLEGVLNTINKHKQLHGEPGPMAVEQVNALITETNTLIQELYALPTEIRTLTQAPNDLKKRIEGLNGKLIPIKRDWKKGVTQQGVTQPGAAPTSPGITPQPLEAPSTPEAPPPSVPPAPTSTGESAPIN